MNKKPKPPVDHYLVSATEEAKVLEKARIKYGYGYIVRAEDYPNKEDVVRIVIERI